MQRTWRRQRRRRRRRHWQRRRRCLLMSCLRTRIATTATMLMRRPRLAVAFRRQQRLHRILMRSWPRFMRRATLTYPSQISPISQGSY